MVKYEYFRNDPYEIGVINDFFYLKIIDVEVKLHACYFVRISTVEIIRLGLVK